MNKKVIIRPKVLSATKASVCLGMFLMFCAPVFSQSKSKLNGNYVFCYGAVDNGECAVYTFNENGVFKKEISGELGMYYYGQGEYRFDGDKLVLDYNKTEPLRIGHHVSRIWTNNRDSIRVHIKFFDFDGNPVPHVNVVYRDSLSRRGYSGVAADKDGLAMFSFKRDRSDLRFEISHLDFDLYKLSIDKSYNHEVSVYLQKDYQGLPIKDRIDTLEVVKMRRKFFKVRNKNGSVTTWEKRDEHE